MNHGEIQRIRDQFQGGHWPQFLDRVDIKGLRGWQGQSVTFRFPVTAIVGENGSGKSTVLKVAAAAYEASKEAGYYPSDFFLDTHWDQLRDVDLGYAITLGPNSANFRIKKPTKRWSFPDKRYKRSVFWFDVARTLPLDATAGYAKVARLAAGEISTEALSDDYRGKLSHILGRAYQDARFAAPDVNEKRPVGLLRREFGEISQFHQGAGEDTTLDLMRALQEVPANSLIIIDEVEASLHPKAQRRLINFLIELSRQRRVQVIVSTHSPYILEELPAEARVLLLPTNTGPSVIYGASPEFSLSKLDDVSHPEAVLYVEDPLGKLWTREILASHPEGAELISRIEVAAVGPANVVAMMGKLLSEGKLTQPGLGILDGDQEVQVGCIALPGADAPELVVFRGLQQAGWARLNERFGVGAGDLFALLDDVVLNDDFHLWPSLVGDRILKSKLSVWETMVTEWCRVCLTDEDRDSFVAEIKRILPAH
jgi:predicted ATPase